jgi:hypothetical protein
MRVDGGRVAPIDPQEIQVSVRLTAKEGRDFELVVFHHPRRQGTALRVQIALSGAVLRRLGRGDRSRTRIPSA